MSNQQDWTPVIIHGKGFDPKVKAQREGRCESIPRRQHNGHQRKIAEETENFEHEKVSYNLATAIQQARNAKGWNRKDLATRLNVRESVITQYETGKAIPDGNFIQKMSKVLGVPLRKKM